MSLAVLIQTKGTQWSFQPSMKARMASVICLTEVNEALRMAWRVMMEKNDSTTMCSCRRGSLLHAGTRGRTLYLQWRIVHVAARTTSAHRQTEYQPDRATDHEDDPDQAHLDACDLRSDRKGQDRPEDDEGDACADSHVHDLPRARRTAPTHLSRNHTLDELRPTTHADTAAPSRQRDTMDPASPAAAIPVPAPSCVHEG